MSDKLRNIICAVSCSRARRRSVYRQSGGVIFRIKQRRNVNKQTFLFDFARNNCNEWKHRSTKIEQKERNIYYEFKANDEKALFAFGS